MVTKPVVNAARQFIVTVCLMRTDVVCDVVWCEDFQFHRNDLNETKVGPLRRREHPECFSQQPVVKVTMTKCWRPLSEGAGSNPRVMDVTTIRPPDGEAVLLWCGAVVVSVSSSTVHSIDNTTPARR